MNDFPENLTDLKREISVLQYSPLTSVQFVMDYLILGFDPKGALTSLIWPRILEEDRVMEFGMPGYRDKLCALIGRPIINTDVGSDETIRISFEGGIELHIPLKQNEENGERVILTGPNNYLFTF